MSQARGRELRQITPFEQLTLEFQNTQRKVFDKSVIESTESIDSSESTTSDKEAVNITRASSKTENWHVDTTGMLTCGYASLSVTAGYSQSVTNSETVCKGAIPIRGLCDMLERGSQRKGDNLMGNRVTRAATHLPEDTVYARMQREQRPWRRKLWEIIYQALTVPSKAEDIARTVGVSASTVHRVIAAYNRGGVTAIETPGKGGRRHQYLTLEQERALLQPFVARAVRGEIATVAEIHQALEERV